MLINSILDNDLYKFTMQRSILDNLPQAHVTYKFISRGNECYNGDFLSQLRQEINSMADLRLTNAEMQWLDQQNWISNKYLSYLSQFKFNPKQVTSYLLNDKLSLEISGNWHETILWEVPLLAMISELYYKQFDQNDIDYNNFIKKTDYKVKKLDEFGCKWVEFGTRRRRNDLAQILAVKKMNGKENFLGTSNVKLAQKYGLRPIGTMAHEWIMGIGSLFGIKNVNATAAALWQKTFGDKNKTILTDTYTSGLFFTELRTNNFLQDWTIRQDSGDPFEFIENAKACYGFLGIPLNNITIIFSDGLDVDKVIALKQHCDLVGFNCLFGIGTNFTNDFEDYDPLKIVIKLDRISESSDRKLDKFTVKLSDEPGKESGKPEEVTKVRSEVKEILTDEIKYLVQHGLTDSLKSI